jgi:hypothetical protein
VTGALVLVLAMLSLCIDRDALLARQVRLQREGGLPEVNLQLYDYDQQHGIHGPIATNYHYMRFLPGMETCYLECNPEELTQFRSVYDRPDVKCAMLFKTTIAPQVREYLDQSGPGGSRVLAESKECLFFGKRGGS